MFHLDLQSLCVFGISPAMKIRVTIILVTFLLSATIRAELPATHPLMHPNFRVVTWPSGVWMDGWLNINQVAAYILGSDDERSAARAALEKAGYGGKNGEHYLYCGEEDEPAVTDGLPFKTRRKQSSISTTKKSRRPPTFRPQLHFQKQFQQNSHGKEPRFGL